MSEDTVILKFSPIVLGRPDDASKDETVSGFVVDAVNDICGEKAPALVEIRNGPTLEAKKMLGVITYCYAKGVLGASEIEQGLWKDDRLRSVFARDIPTARTISRFRRFNGTFIQACLEKTLRGIRRALAHSTLSQSLHAGTADAKPKPAWVPKSTPAPGEGTTILIRKEVVQRLENAAALDSELLTE